MPIKSQHFKSLKSSSFKKIILFFSAVFLFNVCSEKTVIAENQAVISFLFEDISLFNEIKTFISLKKLFQLNSNNTLHISPLSKKTKNAINVKKTAKKNKTAKIRKREPANTAYNCSEHFKDEYSIGFVQLGYDCDPKETLCISFHHTERNRCRNGELTRYYCDPKQESLFSSEPIKCPEDCDSSGLFCASSKE